MSSSKLAYFAVGAFRLALPLIILFVGVFGAIALIKARPEVPRVDREARPVYVETMPIEVSDKTIELTAYGTVQAHRTLVVRPQVSGLVVEQSPDLIRGGILPEGELMVRIDPRDYEYVIDQEAAALERASFDLTLEKGRQVVASREWSLLDGSFQKHELSEELALRKPHLKEKESALLAAQSRLDRAKLDLDRTEIRAPFPALVIEESVEVGQLVMQQSAIATIVGVRDFHIQASIPIDRLAWVQLPSEDRPQGSRVSISRELGTSSSQEVEGHVVRLLGDVDPTGRMARVLIQVDDPLGLLDDESERSALLLGEYVRLGIQGPALADVVALPRRVLRDGNRVWVMTRDSDLAVRSVDILYGNDETVYVRNAFAAGDEVITSALGAAVPGTALTTTAIGSEPQDDAGTATDSPSMSAAGVETDR